MTTHEQVGYLTYEEFHRFRRAVDRSLIAVPWFRAAGYIKGATEEVRAASSNHPLGLPPTWIAAEEIERLSAELRYWPNLEDAANDTYGADTARAFTREVEAALARWPIEDKPRRVRHIRCQQCAGETIRFQPPAYDGDEVHIVCTDCHHTLTEEEFSTLLTLVTEEMKRSEVTLGGSRRLGAA